MPFKRKGRPTYYIGPFVTAGIEVPRISTGVKNKKVAEAMEAMLKALPTKGYGDLVRQVARGTLDIDELYAAELAGDASLKEQIDREKNRLLSDIIGTPGDPGTGQLSTGMYGLADDERVRSGLKQLTSLAPDGARLSWLRDPSNVTDLYGRAVQGADGVPRKPNSVRRSLHRAVSELLTREIGRGKMLAIMADVIVPSENDERVVLLSTTEIVEVLKKADPEFRPVLALAITTGIDRNAVLTTKVRDYNRETAELYVPDTKFPTRKRTLAVRGEPVLENSEVWLEQLVGGRQPGEPLIQLSERQIRSRWEALRAEIDREEVRWKDLRGVFATYFLRAGGQPRNLQYILGHSSMAMTLRYLRRVPPGDQDRMREAARKVGRLEK